MTFQERNRPDNPSVRFDNLASYDLVQTVIAAFHQNVRPDPLDDCRGFVLLKDDDVVDGGERLKLGNPRVEVVDRAITPFKTPNRRVAVQTDDQQVAQFRSFREDVDMTRVKQIETAVCEDCRTVIGGGSDGRPFVQRDQLSCRTWPTQRTPLVEGMPRTPASKLTAVRTAHDTDLYIASTAWWEFDPRMRSMCRLIRA